MMSGQIISDAVLSIIYNSQYFFSPSFAKSIYLVSCPGEVPRSTVKQVNEGLPPFGPHLGSMGGPPDHPIQWPPLTGTLPGKTPPSVQNEADRARNCKPTEKTRHGRRVPESPEVDKQQRLWVVKTDTAIKAQILVPLFPQASRCAGATELTQLLSTHPLPLGTCTPRILPCIQILLLLFP